MRKLTIATCQHDVTSEIKVNLYAVRNQMKIAGSQGADIVHFPETSLSGYAGFADSSTISQDKNSIQLALENICELANHLSIWVLIGCHHFEKGMKKPFNSLYLINDHGKIVNRYDKRLLTKYDQEQEVKNYI